MKRLFFLFYIILNLAGETLHSQPYYLAKYAQSFDSLRLKSSVQHLSNDLLEGRATGSIGIEYATDYILGSLSKTEVEPFFNKSFIQSFKADSAVVRNIACIIRSKFPSNEYIVVSANYDHLGKIEGKIYNGADDNASGVAVLLELIRIFNDLSKSNRGPAKNLIFVFFDGKEKNMVGSQYFVDNLNIPLNKINYNINIKQIGSTMAPPGYNKKYLMILGADGNLYHIRERVYNINRNNLMKMDVDFSFYGSKDFAKIFYKNGDQYSFTKKNIGSIMVTSGITNYNYKPDDDHETLDYAIMAERCKMLFYLVENLSSY